MRIDYNHIKPQIDELITSYGGLKEENTDKNTSIILSGRVSINRSYNGFTVDKEYDIYNVPLVKTQMKKIIVTAKTLYSHPKNVSKIYAALHTDLAW